MIEIDLATIAQGASNPLFSFWFLVKNGGWVAFIIVFLWGFFLLWKNYIGTRWFSKVKYLLLAIDVPELLEPNLKAVEHIFSQVSGIQKSPNFLEKYWEGVGQESISFELVSDGGNVQFFVWTPEYYRDLVEAAIYAQYPEAEISLAQDYTDGFPTEFPDEQVDFWGTQLILAKDAAYPLRSYLNFEYSLAQAFADPMAALLEIFNRLRPGEQVWLQITLAPVPPDHPWRKQAEATMKKLVGAKVVTPKTWLDKLFEPISAIFIAIVDAIVPGTPMADAKAVREVPSLMQYLTPSEQDVVRAIGLKMEKQGFLTKIRLAYVGRKEVFSKATRVGAIMGAIKQFNTENLNALKPSSDVTTKASYFFVKRRVAEKQHKLVKAMMKRSLGSGAAGFGQVLNVEELATLWHFPTETVKAPLVARAASKKVVPPTNLPEDFESVLVNAPPAGSSPEPTVGAPAASPQTFPTTQAPTEPPASSPAIAQPEPSNPDEQPPLDLPVV